MTNQTNQTTTPTAPYHLLAPARHWRLRSVALIAAAWAMLQLGGLFSPGLLDDVDSIYLQVSREMLQRHDFVTPTIDGIRFFDKPPLMYWMAAGSMHLFGIHDWAARLPLALGVLALFLSVYTLGIRLFRAVSPAGHQDRGGLYAALALATSLGPYLYTRFYIPDILIALWMTLAIHLFLLALDHIDEGRSPLLPSLGFAVVIALDVLTKGLIGIVFPLGFVLLYLLCTRRLRLLLQLRIPASTALFLLLAAPWHILAALRNPAIAMPPGLGLPARAGWAWFYLYNEHVARFLGRRIPHDYGQVPIPLFWLLLLLWLLPWVAFLPGALLDAFRELRSNSDAALRFDSDPDFSPRQSTGAPHLDPEMWVFGEAHRREAALTCLLWAGIILGFFTLSSRQEYYHLPALPALALLVGGLLAAADAKLSHRSAHSSLPLRIDPQLHTLRASTFFLVPLGALVFLLCGYLALAAPTPHPGTTLNTLLNINPDLYNLSLGHLSDLTTAAMGFFRGPLLAVAIGFLALGPIAHLLRRRGRTFAANLSIAAAMIVVLMGAHEGLARFYPILGSKGLALQIEAARQPGDLILVDGELTAGSTLIFYTGQSVAPIQFVNGRVNGLWFGSFWPDAPSIFPNEETLHQLWSGPRRIFLLTYHPTQRTADLTPFAPVHNFANSGGKTVLSNKE